MTESQNELLCLVSGSLFNVPYQRKENVQWKQVFAESETQAVTLLAWNTAGQHKEQIQDTKAWEMRAFGMLHQNTRNHFAHAYLHKMMTENGIPYCILKGCSSAYYYPEPVLRAMGDVDFLVSPEDIEKATKVLETEGFRAWDKDHICHIVFYKEDMHFEMHFEPAGIPKGKARDTILEYLSDVFDKAEMVQIDTNSFMKPSDFHHGLILLLHTYHHMLAEGVGIRHLCDLAVFFNHFSNEEFYELFYQRLSDVGLWRFAQIMGQVSNKYLSLPYQKWMGEMDENLCADLMSDIFAGGNFGCKDKNRSNEGYAISQRGKTGTGKNKYLQALISINAAAQPEFPIIKKVKILKPFGWVMLCGRYTFRVLTGKRKMVNIKNLLSGAEQRKQIYEQLRLYEVDKN